MHTPVPVTPPAVREDVQQLGLAREIIYHSYLNHVGAFDIVPFNETGIEPLASSTIRLLEITRLVYDERENTLENLLNIFTALGSDYGAVLVLKSDGQGTTRCFLGVRAYTQHARAQSGETLLKQALDGHFAGTDSRRLEHKEICDVLDVTDFAEQYSGWAISVAPGIPALKTNERNHFTQGLERFIDAMQGQGEQAYIAIILAEPVPSADLMAIQSGYEQIGTCLSSYQKQQTVVGVNESHAVSESLALSIADGISRGVSLTQTHTVGTSHAHTIGTSDTDSEGTSVAHTKGASKSRSHGVNGGLPVFGGNASSSTSVSFSQTHSKSSSHAHTKSESETESTSESDGQAVGVNAGASQTVTAADTRGLTDTTGSSHSLQWETQDIGITRMLERIQQQLTRIDECRAYGAWNASCYILAETPERAKIAAAIYTGALRGMESGIEDAAITVWKGCDLSQPALRSQPSTLALEYLQHVAHPRLLMTRTVMVTPTSLITSKELALLVNFPRKSVGGISVLDGVSFGRDVRLLSTTSGTFSARAASQERQITLGKVHHLYTSQPLDVDLQLPYLVYHTLVTGTTGTGKSTAVTSIVAQCFAQGVPFLVVEPVKGEFKKLALLGTPERPVSVWQAGRMGPDCLRLNPMVFPAGGKTTVIEHIDRICALFNAAFPMYAAMPQILEEAIIRAYERCGWDMITSRCANAQPQFPTLHGVAEEIERIVNEAGYTGDARSTYIGALKTRIASLTRGALGLTFMVNADEETNAELLFNSPAVVDLSAVGSPEKKAILMGLLMLRLQEYRIQQGLLRDDDLLHLMVLEEAHHLLKRTSTMQQQESSNPQGQAVEYFANALAEMRAYGQGFLIVDQSASALDISVLRNTNTKIAFRAPFHEDRLALGSALALDEKQTEALARLEDYKAVVRQGNWLEAVQCAVQKYPLPESDSEMASGLALESIIVRQCRTVVLSTLLGIASTTPDDTAAMQAWVGQLPLDAEDRAWLLQGPGDKSTGKVSALRKVLPMLLPMNQVIIAGQHGAVSSPGLVNHMIAVLQLTTVFSHEIIREVAYIILRIYLPKELVAEWFRQLPAPGREL